MAYTWSLQDYSVYFDGILTHTGSGLGLPNPIKGGGTFHVGQRFNDDGTYDAEKSFQGKLSQLNVWNEILTADEIKSMSKSCYNNVGTIMDWSSLADAAHGAVYKTNNLGDCKTLRKSKETKFISKGNIDCRTFPNILVEMSHGPIIGDPFRGSVNILGIRLQSHDTAFTSE